MNNEQSTMNYELFKTNPISEMPKMVVTAANTTNYNEQLTMNCYSKQTRSNPTCSELVEPILSTSSGFKSQPGKKICENM
jgi:hypothetical protein